MGRPTDLNEELLARFCLEVANGLPITYVCDLLSVGIWNYERWMREGEKDAKEGEDSLYRAFYEGIKKSYAVYVKSAKEEMRSKEKGWQSTAWWLERTNPFFMPKQQIQADDDGKVTVVIGGKQKDPKPVTKKEADEHKGGGNRA